MRDRVARAVLNVSTPRAAVTLRVALHVTRSVGHHYIGLPGRDDLRFQTDLDGRDLLWARHAGWRSKLRGSDSRQPTDDAAADVMHRNAIAEVRH
jgi:hypothetical protein